jgi:hypothetical protein
VCVNRCADNTHTHTHCARRIPSSITSTGLYKEIAKIGKTAAQPFKNIQLSLNDTFNSLGGLTIPMPLQQQQQQNGSSSKPGQLGGVSGGGGAVSNGGGGVSGGGRLRGSLAGSIRSRDRRSQSGKLGALGSYAIEGGGGGSSSLHVGHAGAPADSGASLAALVAASEALQASLKESTSLLRLDLQQHTALQVGAGRRRLLSSELRSGAQLRKGTPTWALHRTSTWRLVSRCVSAVCLPALCVRACRSTWCAC